MDELDDEYMARIMKRFEDDYDPDKQLMGLGDFAVKAPDVQLLTYGLLDMDTFASGNFKANLDSNVADPGKSREELVDRATVVVNSMNRDMVKSGWFAEVYEAGGAIGDSVTARGVRPSLFGISNYIDFIFMANGVRTDEGNPAFVRLPGATGGVSGLSYMGKSYDADIDGETIRLSGEAVDEGLIPSNSERV